MKLTSLRKRLFILPGLLLLAAGPAFCADYGNNGIDRLLVNGSLLLEQDGKIIYSRNPDQPLIPASIWKLATSLATLHTLGPDRRFTTNFYLDDHHTLYVQGTGDPFLVSEEIDLIMSELAAAGVKQIDDLVLDENLFSLTGDADGAEESSNPYDAANGALAVNFNTVNILVGKERQISSAEPQTPTLPLMLELGAGLPPGEHRINIGSDRGRILRHGGELFRAMQKKHGIAGSGQIKAGVTPPHLKAVLEHKSGKNLSQLIEAMLLYSNNFIANQLFLACGAKRFGYPATWEKGNKALHEYLAEKLGLDSKNITVEEGSGLSRKNRATAQAMLVILENFKPYSRLLPLENGRRIKSGTLTGVYSYAGYLPGRKGPDGFVLILNQRANNRNQLLKLLTAIHDKRS